MDRWPSPTRNNIGSVTQAISETMNEAIISMATSLAEFIERKIRVHQRLFLTLLVLIIPDTTVNCANHRLEKIPNISHHIQLQHFYVYQQQAFMDPIFPAEKLSKWCCHANECFVHSFQYILNDIPHIVPGGGRPSIHSKFNFLYMD